MLNNILNNILYNKEMIVFAVIIILVIIIIIINKNRIFSGFENNTTSSVTNNSELDENGHIKNELKPSYWYNYAPSENRSKCFACDAESDVRHPNNCYDCEIKGGRPIDKIFNRVLTR
jgi:hypothetical protein